MSGSKKLISILTVAFIIISQFPNGAFAKAGTGTLSVAASPSGADIYIDDVLQPVTAPCTLTLKEGTYKLEIKLKGYETYIQDLVIKKGKKVKVDQLMLPELVDTDASHIITVNSEGDSIPTADISAADLSGTITLRDAVEAVKNDTSGKHYRIEFAPGISSITLDSPILLDHRGNLTINGDRDRNGTADINMKYSEAYKDYRGLLNVYSSDTYIIGLNFDGSSLDKGSTLCLRVPDTHKKGEKYQINNLYILGNTFKNSFEVGIGTCGSYGYAATEYGGDGTANYSNLVFTGNTFINTSMFSFAGAGDEDYNVIDGYYIEANTFYDGGTGMMASDAHTWYVYGQNNPDGNGGTTGNIKFCEHNILRNVLISGNSFNLTGDTAPEYQGIIYVSTSDLGNSDSEIYNVEIRNNKSVVSEHYNYSTVCIQNASATETGEGKNYNMAEVDGYTSGNIMHDISIHNNDFELGQSRGLQIINVFTDFGNQNGSNNTMYNITVKDNKLNSPNGAYIANYYGTNKAGSCSNNTMYGIDFTNNALDAGNASKAAGITAVATTQTAWDSDRITDYTGSMSDINISNNRITNYTQGVVVAGSTGNAADGYHLEQVDITNNTIICEAPETAGLADFAVVVAGSAYGQPKHGNTNCSVSDITVTGNNITAAGGVAVSGTVVGMELYGSFSGNQADRITVRGNTITKSASSWSIRPLPPVIATGILIFWEGKIIAGTTFERNKISEISILENTYKGFDNVTEVNLSAVPASYKYGSKSTSAGILKALQQVTDSAYGKDTYVWNWYGKSFNPKKAGTYTAQGRSKNNCTGIDLLYYEVTVLPKN